MQALTQSEVRLLLAAPARMRKRIARTLSELLQYNTENPPVESYEIQHCIRDELKRSGIASRLHHPGDKAVALTSSIGSDDGPGLTLYGHVDVVPAGDKSKWRYPPYAGKIVGDRIYGRGASDMKSGVAALLYAYKLLYENDIQLPSRLEFVSVLDEENWHRTPAGWNTTDWLLQTRRLRGNACIMAEPSSISKLCIGERGDFWVRLTSKGTPTHGSRPVYADNASVRLFQCLDEINRTTRQPVKPPKEIRSVVEKSHRILGEEFGKAKGHRPGYEEAGLLEHYSMNVGTVSGGTMINVVPETCQAEIAFCVPLGSTRRQLEVKVRGILRKRQYSNIKLSYLGESQSDPTYTSPKSRIVTMLGGAVRQITGRYPSVYVTQGTSDGNIFRKHHVNTCFYGPGTFETIHGYNESVSIRDTVTAVKVYLLAIIKYFNLETTHAM